MWKVWFSDCTQAPHRVGYIFCSRFASPKFPSLYYLIFRRFHFVNLYIYVLYIFIYFEQRNWIFKIWNKYLIDKFYDTSDLVAFAMRLMYVCTYVVWNRIGGLQDRRATQTPRNSNYQNPLNWTEYEVKHKASAVVVAMTSDQSISSEEAWLDCVPNFCVLPFALHMEPLLVAAVLLQGRGLISRAFYRPAARQSTGPLGVTGLCVVFLGGSGGFRSAVRFSRSAPSTS